MARASKSALPTQSVPAPVEKNWCADLDFFIFAVIVALKRSGCWCFRPLPSLLCGLHPPVCVSLLSVGCTPVCVECKVCTPGFVHLARELAQAILVQDLLLRGVLQVQCGLFIFFQCQCDARKGWSICPARDRALFKNPIWLKVIGNPPKFER